MILRFLIVVRGGVSPACTLQATCQALAKLAGPYIPYIPKSQCFVAPDLWPHSSRLEWPVTFKTPESKPWILFGTFFGFLYGKPNWANWSIENANDCYLEFHRPDGEKNFADIHVYGEIDKAMPLLRDASKYFTVKRIGEVSFFDAFTELTRKGQGFRIAVKD